MAISNLHCFWIVCASLQLQQTHKNVVNLERTKVAKESCCCERLQEEFCEKVKNYIQLLEQGIGSIEINVNSDQPCGLVVSISDY
jgi:hypothetical protein